VRPNVHCRHEETNNQLRDSVTNRPAEAKQRAHRYLTG
jgi:hypothetical protein